MTDEEAVARFTRAASEAKTIEELSLAWDRYGDRWNERGAEARKALFGAYRANYRRIDPPEIS